MAMRDDFTHAVTWAGLHTSSLTSTAVAHKLGWPQLEAPEGSHAVAFVHDERELPVAEATVAAAPAPTDDAAVVPSAPSRDAQGRRWTAKVCSPCLFAMQGEPLVPDTTGKTDLVDSTFSVDPTTLLQLLSLAPEKPVHCSAPSVSFEAVGCLVHTPPHPAVGWGSLTYTPTPPPFVL